MLKRRIAYGALFGFSIVFYIFFAGYFSFYLLLLVLCLPAVSLLLTLPSLRGVSFTIEADRPVVQKGEPVTLQFQLKNRSFFPVPRVRVRLVGENVRLGEQFTQTIFLPAERNGCRFEQTLSSRFCGTLSLRAKKISCLDYLGVFSFPISRRAETGVLILPTAANVDISMNTAVHSDVDAEEFSKVKSGNDPSEVFGLRPYREGDRIRSIHWKLSDKLDQLMVKEGSLPIFHDVLLLLDFLGTAEEQDAAVEVFASLSRFFLDNQMVFTTQWYSVPGGFHSAVIMEEEEFSLVLREILATAQGQKEPLAMRHHNRMDENLNRYVHAIYVSPVMEKREVAEFCNQEGCKITLLHIARTENPPAEGAYPAAWVTVVPGAVERSLTGTVL